MKPNAFFSQVLPLSLRLSLIGGLSAVAYSAPNLQYDTADAVQAGELCSTPASITSSGSQLKIRFSDARSFISDFEGDTAKREACSIRIPVEVPQGYYVNKLTARAQSTVAKPRGIDLTLSLNVILMGFEISPVQSLLGASTSKFGAVNTYKSLSGGAPLTTTWRSGFCNPGRTSSGLLGFNLTASMLRPQGDGAVSVDFSGSSKGIDLWTELARCP